MTNEQLAVVLQQIRRRAELVLNELPDSVASERDLLFKLCADINEQEGNLLGERRLEYHGG